jgi:tyrosine-protein kinase Etk/Wzc
MIDLKKKRDYVEGEMKDRAEKVLNNLKAKLTGEAKVLDVRVLESAAPPSKPSEPDRPKGIMTVTLFAAIGFSALIIFLERSNKKINSEKDLRPDIHVPFLGYVPYVKDFVPKKTGKEKVTDNGHTSLSEELRRNTMLADALATVRTHILFSMPYEKSKTIMFTSTIPGEGKSTVTALLALSFASLGKKVLLIDADLRKPRLQALFNLSNKNGLTDYLVGSVERKDVIKDVPGVDNLKIITTGSQTPNPSELLGSDRFKNLIDESLKEYDRILVDAPPTLYIPDGLIIAKHIQSGILVCGSGVVTKKVAKIVKEKYDSVQHPFIGVIINRADYQKEAHRFKYFHNYQKHYSIVEKKSAA